MSIVMPLSAGSMWGETFADYLNVTAPLESSFLQRSSLAPILDVMGTSELADGVFYLPDKGGTFKVAKRGKVDIFSASGGFLRALRDRRLLDSFLAVFAGHPHRVSMLHVTQDYLVPNPSQAVQEVKTLGQAGRLALTRKRVEPGAVRCILGLNAAGEETGTVYLGHRANADVWAKVYDKDHERVCRGFASPGPIVRVEIAVQSDVGATLRDVAMPAAIFFHFAARSLVVPPQGLLAWEANGQGYALGAVYEAEPLSRLQGIIDGSLDVARAVRLAREAFGDQGAFEVLASILRKRCRQKAAV